jgi:hypothetical protein
LVQDVGKHVRGSVVVEHHLVEVHHEPEQIQVQWSKFEVGDLARPAAPLSWVCACGAPPSLRSTVWVRVAWFSDGPDVEALLGNVGARPLKRPRLVGMTLGENFRWPAAAAPHAMVMARNLVASQ